MSRVGLSLDDSPSIEEVLIATAPVLKAKMRAYCQQPAVKAKMRAYCQQPAVKAKMRAYYQRRKVLSLSEKRERIKKKYARKK